MKPLDVLGLAPGASSDEVRNAYRLLALRSHPDRADGGDAQRFRAVAAAYQVLAKGVGAEGPGASNRRALALFDEAMQELAAELARMGHDEVFIYRALSEEGCPADVATNAAREATYSAPRQRDRAATPWRFSQEPALPMLASAPRSGLGFAAKMGLVAAFLGGMLALVAWLVPETLHRARSVIAPLRDAMPSFSIDSGTPQGGSVAPSYAPPAAAPVAAPPAAPVAIPRVVQPLPAARNSPAGADSCRTDRDCAPGSRCARPNTSAPWSCVPR